MKALIRIPNNPIPKCQSTGKSTVIGYLPSTKTINDQSLVVALIDSEEPQ